MEGDRRGWKVMEPYGSLWKMQECSIGKLCKWRREQSGARYEKGNRRLGKKGGSPWQILKLQHVQALQYAAMACRQCGEWTGCITARVATSPVPNLGPDLNLSEPDPGPVQNSASGLNQTQSPAPVQGAGWTLQTYPDQVWTQTRRLAIWHA